MKTGPRVAFRCRHAQPFARGSDPNSKATLASSRFTDMRGAARIASSGSRRPVGGVDVRLPIKGNHINSKRITRVPIAEEKRD